MPARILVMEDNPANLELMAYLLQACGHSVEVARDGVTGLARARQIVPDLIVSDLQMPLLDGFAVAKALKAEPVLRLIPLIAVTAFAMQKDREAAQHAGFDGFITKPIEPEQFVRSLEAHLAPALHGLLLTGSRAS